MCFRLWLTARGDETPPGEGEVEGGGREVEGRGEGRGTERAWWRDWVKLMTKSSSSVLRRWTCRSATSLCSKKLRFANTWEVLMVGAPFWEGEEGEEAGGGEVGADGVLISATVVRRNNPLSSGLHKLSLKQCRLPTTRKTTIMTSLWICWGEEGRGGEVKRASRVAGGRERSWRRMGVAREMTSFLKFESSERTSMSLKDSRAEGSHVEVSRIREDICVTVLIIVCMCWNAPELAIKK